MDDLEISAPGVSAVIYDGNATISGGFTSADEAKALADKIFALVSDEFLSEAVKYQQTQNNDIGDKEIGMMLGIVIYNRLLKESESHHETN